MKIKRYTHTIVKDIASNFKTKKQFEKANKSAYNYSVRHKIIDELFDNVLITWNRDSLMKYASYCSSRTDFSEKYSGGYHYAIQNNLLDEIYPDNKEQLIKEEIEDLLKLSKKYKNITHLRMNHPKEYHRIHYLGIAEECFRHIIKKTTSLPEQIMTYLVVKMFNDEYYITNNKKILNGLELDLYFPNSKIAFEYNGHYWHKQKVEIDKEKIKRCDTLGIKLYCIYEPEKRFSKYSQIEEFIRIEIKRMGVVGLTNIDDIVIDYEQFHKKYYDLNDLKNIISSCTTQKEFREKYRQHYNFLAKTKQLHFLDNLKRFKPKTH